MSLCKRRGYIWPSFELYGGVAGMFDYGPLGSAMRNNILVAWRDIYIGREGFVEIDSETVNPEDVFKASGHVDEFSDYITTCRECKLPFRADHLVEGLCENPDTLSAGELEKAFLEFDIKCPECSGDLGKVDEFNLMFKTTIGPGSSRTGYLRPETAQGIFVNFQNLYRYNREKLPLGVIQTGRGYRNEISPRQGMIRMREFNMMEVELFVDPEDKDWSRFPDVENEELVLLPSSGTETVVKTVKQSVDEGFIANRVLAYFICTTKQLLVRLGVDPSKLRFRQHLADEMAHYAADCWDAEVLLSYGWTEVTGVADRGCWDLSRHSEFSGTDLSHFKKFDEPMEMTFEKVVANHRKLGPQFKDKAKAIASTLETKIADDIKDGKIVLDIDGEEIILTDEFFEVRKVTEKVNGERVIPHVIEPSYGLDRIFYSVLEHAYFFDEKRDYSVLRLAPEVAPIKVGVFPLMDKDGLDVMAKDVFANVHSACSPAYYDDSGTIGKRYARMDEIGTPWCITVDYESLKGPDEGTVTIRERDTGNQKRIPADRAAEIVMQLIHGLEFSKV